MNKKQLTMLSDFQSLFMPNRPPAEMALYEDPDYRMELVNKILSGDNVKLSDFGANEYILFSGRVSGKTQHDEFAAVVDITDGIGDIWYCRSELGDIRNSIFTSMQNTIAAMGYTLAANHRRADFHVKYSPFEITHNKTGNKIQFFALNKDINRTKGYVAPSKRLKRVMVEEANEVDDPKYIEALISTAVRFFFGNSKLTFRLNPPEIRQHWSVKYFEDREKAGAKRIYTTWLQLAKLGLLTPATVAEIIKMRDNNPLFYRYWYLGEIVNLQGLVFPQFDREKHCVSVSPHGLQQAVSQIIIAGDAANKNDPTCFGFICVLIDGKLLLLDAMYYDPKIGGQLDDVELARNICDWFDGALAKYPMLRNKKFFGTVDNANWNLMRMLECSKSMGWFKSWVAATNKSVLRDVNRLRALWREGLLLLNNAPDNQVESVVAEIENFIYDEKTGEIKKNQDDHGIDMLKYGTYLYADTTSLF